MRITIGLLILSINILNAQLVINEVSQGSSGSLEYVELLVLQDATCPNACIDIRNWIIDDNNGYFASGSGTGIATGVMRFDNVEYWSCISPGTIILIYNESDVNPHIPISNPPDCTIILPGDSPLLDRHSSQPSSTGSGSYAGLTWGDAAQWSSISMSNSNDSYQVVAPYDLTVPHHAVSWGNNTTGTIISFTGSAAGDVFYMANTNNDDPYADNNWLSGAATNNASTTEETPGYPNNAANTTWINTLNNNCTPVPPFAMAGTDVDYCTGENTMTTLTASGGTSYEWSTNEMTPSITVIPTVNTTYTVTVTDASSCTSIDEVDIFIHPLPSPSINQTGQICTGTNSVTLDAGLGYDEYDWSTVEITQSITINSSGTYTVIVTDSNNCTASSSITLTASSVSFLR